MNIVKIDFFISLKGYKSRSAFINFCFSFYKDDFYIFILVKPLKIGPIRFNVLKRRTPKPGLYRPKNCQRFEVLKKVNIRDNGFKNLSSWESIEGRLYVPEDRLYKSVES